MPPRPPEPPPFAVLSFCEQVLKRREQSRPKEAWFWRIRAKVARFERSHLQWDDFHVGSRELTSEEMREILTNHPLLAPRELPGKPPQRAAEWQAAAHQKIERWTSP